MNIDQYLEKLNLKKESCTLNFLNTLISAHQKTISFNNLAVYFNPGQILNLELSHLFQKVILNGEGGYCFENNKVFYHLLKELGYEVEAKAARVLNGRVGDFPRTHRTTIVTIESKKFIADVGFGRNTPVCAIPLDQLETSKNFRVLFRDDVYLLQFYTKDLQIDLYAFDRGHYTDADFAVGNYYTSTHPESRFVRELILSRIEGDVIELISGKTYSRIEKNERVDEEIQNQLKFQAYLRKFGIEKTFDFSKL